MSNRDPSDKGPPGGLSDFQKSAFAAIDAWSDDGADMAVDSAFSRASRGEASAEEQRHARSYDDTGPNSREARESEFERMGRRAGSRASGGDDGSDADLDAAAERIENLAATIGLDPDLAAKIDPAAVDVVADFAGLAVDLDLSEGQVQGISDWLALEVSGKATGASLSLPELAQNLGVAESDLGRMTPGDIAMASRFVRHAEDVGLSISQMQHLVGWAGQAGAKIPASSGRSAGRGDGGGGNSWHTTGEGIPATISKADVPKMSTDQLRALMRSNFRLYEQVGGPAEYSRRLARGGR
jgi:hypothetical protein